MAARNPKLYSLVLITADFVVLVATFIAAYIVRVQLDHRPLQVKIYAHDYFMSFITIVPFWILIFALIGLYTSSTYNRRLIEWAKLAVGCFIGILLVIGWQYTTGHDIFPARLVAVYALVGSFILIMIEREILRVIRDLRFRYGIGIRRVLLVGSSEATKDIAQSLADTRHSGYEVVAIAGAKSIVPKHLPIRHYAQVEVALQNLELDEITSIIQTDLYENAERNQRVLGAAQKLHLEYSFIPGEAEFYSGKNTVDVFLGYPMISVYQTPLVGWGAILKLIFDLIVSTLLIALLSPIFLLLIIIKALIDRGPVFYVSARLSQFSKPIKLIKFRSMSPEYGTKDAIEDFKAMGRHDLVEEYRTYRKVENDPRVTPFGKFLRATSLDELPQLFNVFLGDISLVGPRPILPQEVNLAHDRTALLHSVKSGLTGIWQVSGRNALSFEERIELELYYAQNWTFWLDLKILWKTVGVVLRRTGVK